MIDAARSLSATATGPLICFSHLRWDPVTQRPQHLMSRFARSRPVFFWEEAIPVEHTLPYLEVHRFEGTEVRAVRPRVPRWWSPEQAEGALKAMLRDLLAMTGGGKPALWFYTPMMWPLAQGVEAEVVAYDCMDELSAFRFAPPDLRDREAALLRAADVVFTGGWSLWEAKRLAHDNIHAFPSAVDAGHFAPARQPGADPADQAWLSRPRLGYYGVIDERLDLGLVAALADARPDWNVVMVGPLSKLGEHDLPRRRNLHWLGGKGYGELPHYLRGWDVALMPFAINESTRFISPTKTPEYLAGGVPVVSTPVRDVVRSWGDLAAVRIAATASEFVAACEAQLRARPADWRPAADARVAEQSWDLTQLRMAKLLAQAARARGARRAPDRFPAPGLRRGAFLPYDVVVDWLGQGRLLDDDFTRPSGTKDWNRIGESTDLRPFSLSKRTEPGIESTPEMPEDTVETLEPAEVDYVGPPRRMHEDEDEDVDMIPLIDVTLVLLIFFMMTATTVGAAAFVPTPRSDYGQTVDDPNGVRIDIVLDNASGNPLYAVAEGNKPAADDDKDLDSLPALLVRLKALLDARKTPANLTINAHKDLKAKYARDLILGLRAEPYRSKLSSNYIGVSQE